MSINGYMLKVYVVDDQETLNDKAVVPGCMYLYRDTLDIGADSVNGAYDTYDEDCNAVRVNFGGEGTPSVTVTYADWAENNKSQASYVKNRTHYVDEQGVVHKLDLKYLPDSLQMFELGNAVKNSILTVNDSGRLEWVSNGSVIQAEDTDAGIKITLMDGTSFEVHDGSSYVLTDQDKRDIAAMVEVTGGGDVTIDQIDASKVYFSEDLTTTSAIGNIKLTNGQATIATTGKNLIEVWNSIFVSEDMEPNITQPKVTATLNNAGSYEVGTQITPAYNVSMSAGSYQYGPSTEVMVNSWDIVPSSGTSIKLDGGFSKTGTFQFITVDESTNFSFIANANHTEGVAAKSNLGNSTDQCIVAGTKTATSGSITGFVNTFYGTVSNKNQLTSSAIRSLTPSGKTLNSGDTVTLNIAPGAIRTVVAIPHAHNHTIKVSDIEGMGADITASFSKTGVSDVKDAGSGTIAYSVYYLDYAEAWTTNRTYKIEIV